MNRNQGILFLLAVCVLTNVASMRVWTESYSERIESNATFDTMIENALNENKYIPEECTGIRICVGFVVYHVQHCIDLDSTNPLIDVSHIVSLVWKILVQQQYSHVCCI